MPTALAGFSLVGVTSAIHLLILTSVFQADSGGGQTRVWPPGHVGGVSYSVDCLGAHILLVFRTV